MKQREEPPDNDSAQTAPNGYSFSDANVHQPALVGARTSYRFADIPTSFARVRRLMREGASYSLFGIVFVASANVPTIGGHHGIRNARQYGSPGFETLLRDYDIRGRQRPLHGYQYRGPGRGR